MAIIKCKMCGGDITINEEKTYGMCDYCGSTMTLPKVSDEQRAAHFNRGNHFRRQGEFDKALAVYESIVREDDNDAEAHWCCALCRFGIEYVEDPTTYEYIPTCHRASFDSFLDDVDYLAALEHSDGITKRQYQKDAAKIADVQKGILATSQNEEPFDVFICYKETDDSTGERTRDSLDAQEIYYQLTQEGYRVFFSRITLEDKVGAEYEPYIFAALNSAKVMIVIGSKPEYINAVWVKNEWSRFLAMMRKDRSKLLLPCYKEMDPYDLPEQLSVLQAYDMAKIGFMQDLIRGIKKVIDKDEPKATMKETVVVSGATSNPSTNSEPLLERAFMFLEDGNWEEADTYCEKVLDLDPKNPKAYIGKLMAEYHAHNREELRNSAKPFNDNNNYQKAIRFGDDKVKSELNGYIDYINERNEKARLTRLYDSAVEKMNKARTEGEYRLIAEDFREISGFRDTDILVNKCLEKAEVCRKDAIYESGLYVTQEGEKSTSYTAFSLNDRMAKYIKAIEAFEKIPGWKDSDSKLSECRKKVEEIKAQIEEDRLEKEHEAEAIQKRRKRNKKIAVITIPSVVFVGAFLIVLFAVIIPKVKHNKAMGLIEEGKYEEAYAMLDELGDEETIKASKYDRAEELISAGDYENAYKMLEELGDEETIKASKYDRAIELINSEDYETAYDLLNGLNYKDSEEKLNGIKPQYNLLLLPKAEVGSIVSFGAYNGKEIEWKVLAKEDNKLLVISKDAICNKKYNDKTQGVTWETCTLRKWLNEDFYSSAFSGEEQAKIVATIVKADKNPKHDTPAGNDTEDKVFLLSIYEVNKYISSYDDRKCTLAGEACYWWLRSPGYYSDYAANVSIDGYVYYIGNDAFIVKGAVRPALWINLDS